MADAQEPSVFTCSHGQAYTAWEMECGMLNSHMVHLMEIEDRAHNIQADQTEEQYLGERYLDNINHYSDPTDDSWPWYADAQWEVQEPEIIEP